MHKVVFCFTSSPCGSIIKTPSKGGMTSTVPLPLPPLNSKIRESLPKVPDGFNLFTFRLTVLSVDLTGVISMLPQLERADTSPSNPCIFTIPSSGPPGITSTSYFARYSSILKICPPGVSTIRSFLVEAVVRCFLSMQSYYYIAN